MGRSAVGSIGGAMLAGLLAITTQIVGAQQPGNASVVSDSAAHALIDARVRITPNMGLIVGVIDAHGRRVLTAGTLNGPGTPPPNAKSVFEIGSVTKTFTATVLADMVRRGEVQLDEPVAKLLSDSVRVPSRGEKQITLLDLATQSSGLPPLPTNFAPKDASNPYADYSVSQLYAFLSSYTLTRDPGAQYEYSNLGVGLLGLALSRRAGMSYEEMVRQRVTAPLKMADTRITLSADERKRLAPGHDVTGDTVSNWDLPTFAGAGAIRSTMNDMLTYLTMYMKQDTTTALGRDARMAATAVRATTLPNMRVGLAWHVRDVPGSHIVWHNGETGGYHSFVGFDRDHGTGVVILGNAATNTDDIGFHLLDPSFPITPPTPRTHPPIVKLTPAQLQPYVGKYQMAPAVTMTVSLDKDQLFVQLTGQSAFPIYPESDGRFFLKVVAATIDFERDSQQKVVGVVLHQNGRDLRGARVQP